MYIYCRTGIAASNYVRVQNDFNNSSGGFVNHSAYRPNNQMQLSTSSLKSRSEEAMVQPYNSRAMHYPSASVQEQHYHHHMKQQQNQQLQFQHGIIINTNFISYLNISNRVT